MGLALLDTTAVAAFLAPDDPLHADADMRLRQIARDSFFAASALTWAELIAGPSLARETETGVRGFFDDFGVIVLPVDEAVAERAAELRARRRGRPALELADALVLATADVDPDIDVAVGSHERWARVHGLNVELVRLRRVR